MQNSDAQKKILSVLVVVLLLVGWWFYENRKTPSGIDQKPRANDETANWKIYRDEAVGFEVKYPEDVFHFDKTAKILSHSLKYFHRYSFKDKSDLGPASDITITFRPDPTQCNYLVKPLDKGGLGLASSKFSIGKFTGKKFEMGAEGEGIVYYCIQDQAKKNIFLVERYFLNEIYSDKLLKTPDYLSSKKQEEIFDKILSTLKFIK